MKEIVIVPPRQLPPLGQCPPDSEGWTHADPGCGSHVRDPRAESTRPFEIQHVARLLTRIIWAHHHIESTHPRRSHFPHGEELYQSRHRFKYRFFSKKITLATMRMDHGRGLGGCDDRGVSTVCSLATPPRVALPNATLDRSGRSTRPSTDAAIVSFVDRRCDTTQR